MVLVIVGVLLFCALAALAYRRRRCRRRERYKTPAPMRAGRMLMHVSKESGPIAEGDAVVLGKDGVLRAAVKPTSWAIPDWIQVKHEPPPENWAAEVQGAFEPGAAPMRVGWTSPPCQHFAVPHGDTKPRKWTGSISDAKLLSFGHFHNMHPRRPWYVRLWRRITGERRRELARAKELLNGWERAFPDVKEYRDRLVAGPAMARSWEQMVGRTKRAAAPKRPPWYVRAWRRVWGVKHIPDTIGVGLGHGMRPGDGPLRLSGFAGDYYITDIHENRLDLATRSWPRRAWDKATFAKWRNARRWSRS